jgi:hypothetical protein
MVGIWLIANVSVVPHQCQLIFTLQYMMTIVHGIQSLLISFAPKFTVIQ